MQNPQKQHRDSDARDGASTQRSALPGRGGVARILSAFRNTASGLHEGLTTEAAIKQEFAVVCIAVPLSFFLAQDLWTWVALMASLMLVFAVEFLNTAIERLCNHIQPEKHEQIRITKDLASAGVFFGLLLCGLVWSAALFSRFAAAT